MLRRRTTRCSLTALLALPVAHFVALPQRMQPLPIGFSQGRRLAPANRAHPKAPAHLKTADGQSCSFALRSISHLLRETGGLSPIVEGRI